MPTTKPEPDQYAKTILVSSTYTGKMRTADVDKMPSLILTVILFCPLYENDPLPAA